MVALLLQVFIVTFIAAIVFFVLWREEQKKGKKVSNSDYEKGYYDGYWGLAARLRERLFSSPDSFDIELLKREIQFSRDDQLSQSQEDVTQQSPTIDRSIDIAPFSSIETPVGEELSESDIAAQAKQDSVRNMNVMLFVASLLFVAAGAAFVTTAMPDVIKLLGIWLLTAAFYAVGLSLQDSDKFRPAGVAFAGTGLGLLPFAGIVLYQLTDMSGTAVWALTSLTGVVMYYYAAIALQSQTVSYLTMAFVVSFAASLGDVVGLPMVWSFVSVIAASLTITILASMKPDVIPDVFSKPVEQSAQLVTPLTLLLSLFFAETLTVRSYELLSAVGLAYYGVAWFQTKQVFYIHIVRALAQVLALLFVWDLSGKSFTALGIGIAVTAILQQAVSFVALYKESIESRWVWIVIMQSAMFMVPAVWANSAYSDLLLTADYFLLGGMSVAAAVRFRQAAALVPAVIMSVLLPFIIGRLLLEPAISWDSLAAWFVVSASLAILARFWLTQSYSKALVNVIDGSSIVYTCLAVVLALFVDNTVATVLFLSAAFLFWVLSYVSNQKSLSLFGNIAWVLAVYKFATALSIPPVWQSLWVWAVAGVALYGGVWYMISKRDEQRAVYLLATFWVLGFFAVALSFFGLETKFVAALSIAVIALTVALEGWRRQQRDMIEVAVYIATFGFQRMLGSTVEDVSAVFYAHWWAATIYGIGVWRKQDEKRTQIALAFITASTGLYALFEGGIYQLLFLVEQVALLIAGALFNKKWAIWWGLAGSVAAVMWFLRDILFVAFAFLGLVVVGVVVWRLKNSDESDASSVDDNPGQ